MTITITRGNNSFEYRAQRAPGEQEPLGTGGAATHVLEGRATYKGSRWQFIARFDTPEEARQALFNVCPPLRVVDDEASAGKALKLAIEAAGCKLLAASQNSGQQPTASSQQPERSEKP